MRFVVLTYILLFLSASTIWSQDLLFETNTEIETSNKPDVLELYFCDQDGNGQFELNIEEITQLALNYYGLDSTDPEAILLCTSNGSFVKVSYPSSNINIDVVCNLSMQLTDIAVNDDSEIFTNTFTQIFKMDAAGCAFQPIIPNDYGNAINSLSFDTGGNMYFGFANSSKIYRYDAGGLINPYVWHNFELGNAGGDFVMVDGKLYIAWDTGSFNRLYEVNVDANYNYVSHIDKLELPNDTYGLASEFGSLYGVTIDWLYRINRDTNTFESVLYNDNANGFWYGAAGLHEGILLNASAYLTFTDADNATNALPDLWTNTVLGQQIIYIRIQNETTGQYVIQPVIIHLDNISQIVQPQNLVLCGQEEANIFDLQTVEAQLLQNVTEPVVVSYHLFEQDAETGEYPLSSLYQSNSASIVVYVRVKNTANDCYAVTSFKLIINPKPTVAPIVTDISERSLNNCYITKKGKGYFKLDEIYGQVVLDENTDYSLSYYNTLTDAENDVNSLPQLFFPDLGRIYEIFVKVTTAEGCSAITNFFVNGDCVLYTLDLQGIYFPLYFTPNNDGYHDSWNINGVSEKIKKESTVTIFDRYGKVLYKFRPYDIMGWNGTYNGKIMASNDYWFIVETPNGTNFSGHFSLKR